MSSPISALTKKLNIYKALLCATALLYFYLFIMLLFSPGSFLDDLGVAGSETAFFLARRTAMLMLGFSVVAFFGRNAPNSAARQAIIIAISMNMTGFAVMSCFEFLRGFANASILQAAIIETVLAIVYFLLWLVNRKPAMPAEAIPADPV